VGGGAGICPPTPSHLLPYHGNSQRTDILCRIPRGADDQTPDDVVMIGGIYLNLTDGRIGKSVASVNSHHKQKSPEKK